MDADDGDWGDTHSSRQFRLKIQGLFLISWARLIWDVSKRFISKRIKGRGTGNGIIFWKKHKGSVSHLVSSSIWDVSYSTLRRI